MVEFFRLVLFIGRVGIRMVISVGVRIASVLAIVRRLVGRVVLVLRCRRLLRGGGNLGLLSKSDMRAQNIKFCVRCQTVKPLSAFSPVKRSFDGHDSWCKSCRNSYQKARNASIAESSRAKAVRDGLSLHVPSRRVVARNGVPASGEPVPKNLKPLLSVGDFSGSSVSAPTVTTELSTDGIPPLDSKDAVNPLFSGISSRELLEELQARGFDLHGACHVEVRVVRSAVKL